MQKKKKTNMDTDEKSFSSKLFEKLELRPQQIIYLLLANIGYALAVHLFYMENNITAGGLTGIGTLIDHFLGIPVGVAVFCLNLPICLWGLTIKGKKYILYSVITVGVFSFIIDSLSFLPCLTNDKLVAVVCGGIIYGVAAYCSIRAQISTGGTDLLAKLLITKFKCITIGQMMMLIDGSIVVLAIIVYHNIEAGIYALLAIAVSAIVTDKLSSGFNKATMFYIFPTKNMEKMTYAIINDMVRGGTVLNGRGIYANTDKEILLCVVKTSETPRLKDIVHKYDPSAFIILSPATEIIGQGFESLNLTSTIHDDDNVDSEA